MAATSMRVNETPLVLYALRRADDALVLGHIGLDLIGQARSLYAYAAELEGTVEMALNFSLEPWEVEAGFVLTCQAYPATPHVVIDYDQV